MEYPSLLLVLLIISAAFITSTTHAIAFESCDASSYGGITIQPDAQAFIGVLMSLRSKGEDGYGCGELSKTEDVPQAYEAMKWTLDRLNQDSGTINGVTVTDSYIRGVKIGMLFRETCGRTELTTTKATEFLPQLQSKAEWCFKNDSYVFLGMVGETSSQRTIKLASVLQDFDVGLVSPFTDDPSLSDSEKYPYFLRTVPSDTTQAEVIVKTMKELQWEHFAIIYMAGPYGTALKDALVAQAAAEGLCVSGLVGMEGDSEDVARDALHKVMQMGVTGVVSLTPNSRVILENIRTVPSAGKLQFLFPDTLGPDEDLAESLQYTRGVITVSTHSRNIPEFEDHWVRLDPTQTIPDNPWFREWYMLKETCRLPGETTPPFNTYPSCNIPSESQRRADYSQLQYTESAIMSVYTYARALKNAHSRLCGSNSRGLCRNLIELDPDRFFTDYVKDLDLTFSNDERIPTLATRSQPPDYSAKRLRYDNNGDVLQPMYDVWSFNDYSGQFKFEQVAIYTSGDDRVSLDLNKVVFYDESRSQALASRPTSLCPDGRCSGCVSPDAVDGVQYAHVDGDLLIGGTFSVHSQGDNGLSCGEIDKQGAQLLQAFLYAIDRVNQRGILRSGVQLGGVAFDECSSGIVATSTLRQFHTGMMDLMTGAADPARVQAYVGSGSNDITEQTGSILQELLLPLIGYRAMGDDLDVDMFARTLVSDDRQAKALILLLKKLGWNYVQLIHQDSDAARSLSMQLHRYSIQEGICFSKAYQTGDNMHNDEIIRSLASWSNSQILVLVGDGDMQRQVLQALNRTAMSGRFTFVTTLGMKASTIQDLEEFAEGTLTLRFPETTLTSFRSHLRNLDPASYTTNPWFGEWYEVMYDCYLDPSNMKGYPRQCTGSSITSSSQYTEDPHSIFVINAVYAIAYGLDTTLKYYCGDSYRSVCSLYTNAADRSNRLLSNILAAEFQSESSRNFKFSDGQAEWPLEIYNVDGGSFRKVGDYTYSSGGEQFNFNTNGLEYGTRTKPMPTCMAACTECQYMHQVNAYIIEEGDLYVAAVYDLHNQGSQPFGCSGVKMSRSYQYTEAFRYALEKVNNGEAPVSLNNVKIGGLIVDGCSSPLKSAQLVSGIHSESIKLKLLDGMSSFKPGQIFAWFSSSSDPAVEMADIVGTLGMPQLGIAATSSELNDRERLPTFFNTMSTDDVMMKGIMRLVQQMGWKYIQVVHTDNDNTRQGVEDLVAAAREMDICVLASYEVNTDGTHAEIVNKLMGAPTDVVITVLTLSNLQKMLEAKQSVTGAARLTFISSEIGGSLETLQNNAGTATSSLLAFKQISPKVDDFDTFLSDKFPDTYMANPWFHDYYQKLLKCDLGPKYSNFEFGVSCDRTDSKALTSSQDYVQDFLLINNINAVYAASGSLDMALREICGATYDGICKAYHEDENAFATLVEKMEQVTFTDPAGLPFRFKNRQRDSGYIIYQFDGAGQYTEVGRFENDALNIIDTNLKQAYGSINSACDDLCYKCNYIEQEEGGAVFTDGDIILAGVFDVHEAGTNPFTCGDINMDHGYQLMEAFNYAIDYVNRGQGIFSNMLKGVKLGSLVLDACKSPTRAGNMVANVQTGQLSVNGADIPVDSIKAYVGAYDSDSSKQVASVLNELEISQISYGSTSTILQNKEEYPFFLRTVPADNKQARGMVALLKRFDLDYVQVVYSPGSYGEGAAAAFVTAAKTKRVCVAQTVAFDEGALITREMANRVVRKMLQKPNAKVVVVYLATEYIHRFLEAVNSNDDAKGKFHFIGSESWEKRLDVIENVASAAYGSVTFGVETADITGFDGYLKNLPPGQGINNGWFDEYFQDLLDCSLQSGNPDYPRVCQVGTDFITNPDKGYVQDSYVIYTVNAVYAAAMGINEALERICGKDQGVCDDFRNSPDQRQEIYKGIKDAHFLDQANQVFEFNADGESNRGYHIYTLKETSDGYYYDDVGSYNDYEPIDPEFNIEDWGSNCKEPGSCDECSTSEYKPTHIAEKPSPSDNNFVAFFDIHKRDPEDPLKCGPIDIGMGMQNYLAYYYAMEKFNEGVADEDKVGGMAIDSCGNSIRVIQDAFSIISGETPCGASGAITPTSIKAFLAMENENALEATKLLAPSGITTVSPKATTNLLNNAEYFLRTVPPDDVQASAMAAILRQQGWYYVATVNSDNSYGNGLMDAFKQAANDSSICVAASYVLNDTDTDINDAVEVLQKIDQKKGVSVIVLFTTTDHAKLLLDAAKKSTMKGKFIFLASDTWADNEALVQGVEDYARGSISTKVQSAVSLGFREWVKSLTVQNHGDIPDDWFEEFWQHSLKCRLNSATVVLRQYTRECASGDRLRDEDIANNPYILHTIIATQTMAKSQQEINQCQRDNCDDFYNTMKNSDWTAPPGELENNDTFPFKFNDKGYGEIGYDIMTFKRINPGQDEYAYFQIGTYTDESKLDFDQEAHTTYDRDDNARSALTSICPTGEQCGCIEGTEAGNGGRGPGGGVGPTAQPVKANDDNFDKVWAIILIVLTGIGIVVTILLFVYLLIMYPIKGGTSVLGYMLLFGVLCIFILNFAFLLYPDDAVCGIRRLCLGLVYAICFSAMLVKVLNTWRIGDELDMSYNLPSYERLSHPCSLFLIAVFLSLVQAIIGVEWLILDEPGWEYIDMDGDRVPWCKPTDEHNKQMIISCTYVILLIFLTLIFSVTTWDSEENHRESRWILITTLFTIGIWIVWGIISTMSARKYRDPAIVIAGLVNGAVILLCIFFRKLLLLNRYNKEIEEERKSGLSYQDTTLSRGNGAVYINRGYDGDTLGSHKSHQSYVYNDYNGAGGDIAY